MNKDPNITVPMYQYPLCDFHDKCVNDGTPQEQVMPRGGPMATRA